MLEKIKELRRKRAALITEARGILDAATGDVLSTEDSTRYDALMAESDALKASYERMEHQLDEERELSQIQNPGTRPDVDEPIPGRSGRAVRANATPEYRAIFGRYLATGVQERALQMDSDAAGGFAVAPQEFSDQIIKAVDDQVFIRPFATTMRVANAASLGVPSLEANPADADWTTELQTGQEDAAMMFGKREFRPNPLAKLLKVSNKLVRAVGTLAEVDADQDGTTDSFSGIDAFIAARLAYKFGIAQEKGFLTGSGTLQPLGLFTASADGIDTSRDVACASPTAIAADDLIETKYSLKAQYQDRAVWLFHRTAIKAIRKLKDTNGQYIWAPGGIGQASLAVGAPDTILERPFYQSEYVPNTFTTGLYVGLYGDLSFYWIADALDMTVQRLVELFAQTNQIGYIGRLESDGMPVLAEAFARVKLA